MASVFKILRRPWVQITLLTGFFAAVYFGMRSIPASSCNFLHYEQALVTADGLQFCGSGAGYFVDVGRLPFPVNVVLTPDHPPVMGEVTHYTMQIKTTAGRELRPSELAISQTRKLHLLLVDPTLEDYQHIHPEPDGDSGTWTFDFTPRKAGDYQLYAQFIPLLSMREMVGETQINVPGQAGAAVQRGLAAFKDGDYVYELASEPGEITAGSEAKLLLRVHRADGQSVRLEEIMGTLAHLVAFDPVRPGVAHLHPTYTGKERDPAKPEMAFLINLTEPGRYRIWGQVKIDGRERFMPFDVTVAKG